MAAGHPIPSSDKYADLIGEHSSIKEMRRLIERVAASTAKTVLIYGETGTGKGMVAGMIHDRSRRKDHTFLDINCAAIPGTLLESELFGHERGAFTGASSKKRGLIETAHRGTVFLDEIREMDLALQAKLLGVLDTQRFRPLGAIKPVEVDVRFVAATNKNLNAEVKSGHFREDLYYRLQVVVINLPPLRDRGDDVFLLTGYYLDRFCKRYGRLIRGCEKAVEEIFRAYSWPGNIRELENLIERIFLMEDDDRILIKHLPLRILREVDKSRSRSVPISSARVDLASCLERLDAESLDFHAATDLFQRAVISSALRRCENRLGSAATALGLTRHSLRYYMDKLNLNR